MRNKIYIDCTNTYFSNLNTGIQRVVRNIIKNINEIELTENIELVPVIFNGHNFIPISKLPDFINQNKKSIIKKNLKKIYIKIRSLFKIIPFVYEYLSSPNLVSYLNLKYDLITSKIYKQKNKSIEFNKNDILLLLDATWLELDFDYLNSLKQKDIKIYCVVYDIVALTHPIYCSEDIQRIFKVWFNNVSSISDGFITISKTVKNDIKKYLMLNYKHTDHKKINCFSLASDFYNDKLDDYNPDIYLKDIIDKNKVFITVGTLEPRKNHIYVLNAFEILWKNGSDLKYVIIARIGWKVDELLRYIKNHSEFNKKLFLLDNIDDKQLLYIYQNTRAMIFASHSEGFGLPIVESLNNNLQVLASNIPIHKEIGQEYITYFDINDVNDLVCIIKNNNFDKDLTKLRSLTWKDSTNELINTVILMASEE